MNIVYVLLERMGAISNCRVPSSEDVELKKLEVPESDNMEHSQLLHE
jgi:hypothetical protein